MTYPQATVRGFIRAYNERFDATVILTSHYLEDVVPLCPRVVVKELFSRGRAEATRAEAT